jgi:hypothetical protein
MTDTNLTISFAVSKRPEAVFAAITNVAGWWSKGLQGRSEKPGDVFTYRHKDLHLSKQRVVEAVPGERVVWEVLEADLSFVKNRHEWKGTQIRFELVAQGGKTELRFTHVGLKRDCECFEACSDGWSYYLQQSLKPLIETGVGQPDEP